MVSEQAYCGGSRISDSHKKYQYHSAGAVSTKRSDTGSESSERSSYENTNYDHGLLSSRISRSHTTPGSQNSLTHLNSSWIQRLIPQQMGRMEQECIYIRQQETDSRGSASVWTNRKMDIRHPMVPATQPKPPVYENSRRSKHNFYGSSNSSVPDTSLCNGGASSRPYEYSNSVQPQLHVSPNPLPLVESLLTGDHRNFNEARTHTETSRFHSLLSKGVDIPNQAKRPLRLESDPGINSRTKTSGDGSFSFFQSKLSPSSIVAPCYSGNSQGYRSTNVRSLYMGMPDVNTSLHTYSVGRRGYGEHTFADDPSSEMANKGLFSDSYEHTRHLFPNPMQNLRDQGGYKFPEHPWQSDINRVWDNSEESNKVSHHIVEQKFTISSSSHREHSAASESFSFHFGRMFPSDAENAHGSEVERPFPTKEQIHNATVSGTAEEGINFFGQSESRCVNTRNNFNSFEKRDCVGMSSMDGQTHSYRISGSLKPDSLRSSMKDNILSYMQTFDGPEKMYGSPFRPQDQRQAISEERGFHQWSEMKSKYTTECHKYREQTYSYVSEQRPDGSYPFKRNDLMNPESGSAGLEKNDTEYRNPGAIISSLRKRTHDAGKAVNTSISNMPFDKGGTAKRSPRHAVPILWESPVGQPKMWLQRWLSAASKADLQNDSDLSRETTISKDRLHHIDFYEGGWRTIQGSSGISHLNYESSDHRPAKRMCNDRRYTPGNPASIKQQTNGMASHFMKRYFTPSAAAMAIIGTTARHVHATQPQKKGIFGVWRLPSKISSLKSDFVDTSNEFETVKQPKFFQCPPEKKPPAVDA